MKSVRLPGLFNDEMRVWPVNAKTPDFLYVDMLFDAIVAIGTTASRRAQVHARGARPRDPTIFWCKSNVTPPDDMARWGDLITFELVRFCSSHVGRWNGCDSNWFRVI